VIALCVANSFFINDTFNIIAMILLALLPLSTSLVLVYSTKKLHRLISDISEGTGNNSQNKQFMKKISIIAISFVFCLDLQFIWIVLFLIYDHTIWSDPIFFYFPEFLTALSVFWYLNPFIKEKEDSENPQKIASPSTEYMLNSNSDTQTGTVSESISMDGISSSIIA